MALVEGSMGFGVLAMWASRLHRSLGLSLCAIVALFGLGGMLYSRRHLIRRFGQQGLVLVGGRWSVCPPWCWPIRRTGSLPFRPGVEIEFKKMIMNQMQECKY